MSMKISPRHSRIFGIVVAYATCTVLFAQKGEEYYINGIYNPTLADVHKIDLRPVTYDTVLPAKVINYQLLDVKGQVPVRVDSIEAAKLNIQLAQEKLYKGFVKAGFGLYTTPLFELYYDEARSRTTGYGIHFNHMSSNGGLEDVGPSDYGDNRLDAYYASYMRHHKVEGRILYDRRRISYYGYSSTDSLENLMLLFPDVPADTRKQVYNDIGLSLRVKSLYRDSTKLAHDIGVEVHNYTNLAKSTELSVKIDGRLSMEQGAETYGGDILIDNNAYRGVQGGGLADLRQSGTIVGLSPFISTESDKYLVKVGAGMFFDSQGKTTFHFYPQAYLQYRLFDDILVPYAGVDGRRIRNSFRSLTTENPFMVSAPDLLNSSLMYDVYGGLRGSLSREVGFDVRISKSRTKDRALFVGQANDVDGIGYGMQFQSIYDRVDQLDIGGELRYAHDEHVDVHGALHVFSYTPYLQTEAWNLPSYSIGLGATYDFQDKLVVKVEAQFLGSRKAGELIPDTIPFSETPPQYASSDLGGYIDLFLGLEYRYTKRFSVFLNVSNLSASRYERWYRYPVQRTLIMGGASFAF